MFSTIKDWLRAAYGLARRRPVVSLIVLAVAVLCVWFFLFKGKSGAEEVLVIQRGDFVQVLSISGKVVAAQDVDLSFKETGRIESVQVKVGDEVSAGALLATLSTDTLASELRAAQIDLSEAQKEQDTLVANARRELFSQGLAAVPNSSSYDVQSPTVTGLYNGEEGTYKLSILHGPQPGVNDHQLRTSDLEKTGPVEILEDEPTMLGTKGLFITFPDVLDSYDNTIWYVTIPNTKSSSYLSDYNAYQEALRARDKVIANAQTEIDRVKTEISDRQLRAPFRGIVTEVKADQGALASPSEVAISLIGTDSLQIECFVPEINLASLEVGDHASTTLDAYGSNVFFGTTVVSIDPAETIRDGVSTYRTVLTFDSPDERIRSGLTADVAIVTQEKHDTIVIPQGAVIEREGGSFVMVKKGKETAEQKIETGARSLGSVEVLSGLAAGDTIVLNP